MRRLLFIPGAGLICLSAGFAWVSWLSPQARQGQRNWRNTYQVLPGMRLHDALAIMGPAQSVERNALKPDETIYTYTGQPFAGSEIGFAVGSDSLVLVVSHGD